MPVACSLIDNKLGLKSPQRGVELHADGPRVRVGSKWEILCASRYFPLVLQTQTLLDAVGTSHLCRVEV